MSKKEKCQECGGKICPHCGKTLTDEPQRYMHPWADNLYPAGQVYIPYRDPVNPSLPHWTPQPFVTWSITGGTSDQINIEGNAIS